MCCCLSYETNERLTLLNSCKKVVLGMSSNANGVHSAVVQHMYPLFERHAGLPDIACRVLVRKASALLQNNLDTAKRKHNTRRNEFWSPRIHTHLRDELCLCFLLHTLSFSL